MISQMNRTISFSDKWIHITFLLWWITLPFQSKLLGFSLGAFTLYPNLLISILLFSYSVFQIRSWNNWFKVVQIFLFLWITYGILQAFIFGNLSAAFFDIRSLVLQFLFSSVLFGVHNKLGHKEFKSIAVKGIRLVLFSLLIFGLFEFFTGIHFIGSKTDEMNLLPVSNHFYAPMFIFDNQNTYLTYVISFVLFLTLFDEKFKENSKIQLLLWVLIYIFALYAESNFAKLIFYINGVFILIQMIRNETGFQQIKKSWPYLLSVSLLVGLYFSNERYLGPLFGNSASYRINSIQSVEKDSLNRFRVEKANEKYSKKEQIQIIKALDSIHQNNPNKSLNLRKQMILAGMELISDNKIFGAGPGAFNTYCETNKDRFQLKTQRSAHNFPIEIISQYGIVAWIYFALVGWLFVRIILVEIQQNRLHAFGMVILSFSFAICWLMPSAFLLLEVSRLLLPLLVIYYFSEKSTVKNG